MFVESVDDIIDVVRRCSSAVFVMPADVNIEIPGAIIVQPEEKTTITIEQMRQMMGRLGLKQVNDIYVVIRPADKMGEEAANAFLKSLEEPGDKVHYVLVTDAPSKLLPTILSRVSMYILRTKNNTGINADARVKELAKKLMVAKGAELVTLAEEICKKKERVREYALEVVGTVIEMLYKTYYITGKMGFIAKLPKFLAVYDAISRNGNIKLQIVAGLG